MSLSSSLSRGQHDRRSTIVSRPNAHRQLSRSQQLELQHRSLHHCEYQPRRDLAALQSGPPAERQGGQDGVARDAADALSSRTHDISSSCWRSICDASQNRPPLRPDTSASPGMPYHDPSPRSRLQSHAVTAAGAFPRTSQHSQSRRVHGSV